MKMAIRTTLYGNQFQQISYFPISIFHNTSIKAALNTIREKLHMEYNQDIYLFYCDNEKEEKEIKFKITTLTEENYETFLGYLEFLQ